MISYNKIIDYIESIELKNARKQGYIFVDMNQLLAFMRINKEKKLFILKDRRVPEIYRAISIATQGMIGRIEKVIPPHRVLYVPDPFGDKIAVYLFAIATHNRIDYKDLRKLLYLDLRDKVNYILRAPLSARVNNVAVIYINERLRLSKVLREQILALIRGNDRSRWVFNYP